MLVHHLHYAFSTVTDHYAYTVHTQATWSHKFICRSHTPPEDVEAEKVVGKTFTKVRFRVLSY